MKDALGTVQTSSRLFVWNEHLAVCRLSPDREIPAWSTTAEFFSITRAPGEISIVCPEYHVPAETTCERGWIAIGLEGPLDFSLVGVLAKITKPLAEAGVSVCTISTYETDYVLVKHEQLELATIALRGCGYEIR